MESRTDHYTLLKAELGRMAAHVMSESLTVVSAGRFLPKRQSASRSGPTILS